MINKIEVYHEMGKEAGLAVRNGDAARVKHVIRWFNKAKSLESVTDRFTAEQAYKEGYRLEATR